MGNGFAGQDEVLVTVMEPASIRYKNPGAMWGNALAIKWGAQKKAVVLHDGLGQGNNIAVFPTYVQGICAQLDLWRTSKNYKNKRFADAIAIWAGHNQVESYISFVLKRVPGMTRDTMMNDDFWQSPSGIAFLKAQAWHEAGKKYPAPDADWAEAQRRVFEGEITADDPAPEAAPAAESSPPSIIDKIVPIARSIAGTGAVGAAAGQVASTIADSPSDVAEKVTQVTDKSGAVIAATKQVIAVPKPGFWNGLLSVASSPGFLVSMIVLMAAMWFLVWFIQRQHQQQAAKP